jgi:meiotically up-regulated gene 157 (Mug157) protein
VSAAYWDRDAMLWSFPALLDTDPARAREALDYALGVQGPNAGVHSRYIDGVVLEDGFELDELVAPLIALASYVEKTGDTAPLTAHREQVALLRKQLAGHRDPATGLYDTFQDAQDEYIQKPFQVYDNVLVWKALRDLAALDDRMADGRSAVATRRDAALLKAAILRYGVATPPGGTAPIFASAVDGKTADFADVPPGSLMKLPALGFVGEDDPLFRRTYDWLHGPAYKWNYADQPYGLPGSYRLPFTTSWLVADYLRLAAGRPQALKILRASPWDGGIITEGVKPDTGRPDQQGRAFATAAGYVAHAICDVYCADRRPSGQ